MKWKYLKSTLYVSVVLSVLPTFRLLQRVLQPSATQLQRAEAEFGRSMVAKKRNESRTSFYILPTEELTSWLIGNFSQESTDYYIRSLNEESAEIWIHLGLQTLHNRVTHAADADVVFICAYLHLNQRLSRKSRTDGKFPLVKDEWIRVIEERLIPGKPHVLAVPTWNPTVAQKIGMQRIVKLLDDYNIQYACLGFERNPFWQKTDPNNILAVPYVVKTELTKETLLEGMTAARVNDFVFYAGDERKHAVAWSGCNRTQLIGPLSKEPNMDIKIRGEQMRLPQSTYNERMLTSDFCLILCGDTPTSRSLASAIVHGCIPVHVGERWWGRCDPPCKSSSWGWAVTTPLSHFPYSDDEHQRFPVLDEQAFASDPRAELNQMLSSFSPTRKQELRRLLGKLQLGWLYGWGDPVGDFELGEATPCIYESVEKWLGQTTYG